MKKIYRLILTFLRGVGVLYRRLSAYILTFLYSNACEFVGLNTRFQNDVYIMTPASAKFGKECFISSGVIMTTEIRGSYITFGDSVQINQYVKIDYTGGLTIGNKTLISENTYIYTHSHGRDPKSPAIPYDKIIGDNVWVGVGAIVLPSCQFIGSNSIIGAGAVVTKNVPENAVVAGNPASVIRYLK